VKTIISHVDIASLFAKLAVHQFSKSLTFRMAKDSLQHDAHNEL